MANEQMKETVRKLYDAFNRGDYSVLESIIPQDFTEHEELGPGIPQNRAGLIQWLQACKQAFPDFRFEAEDIAAEGDHVFARVTVSGTHQGNFMGIPATGKSVHFELFDELRFDGNKLSEHWGQADLGGLMRQLGVSQPSGA